MGHIQTIITPLIFIEKIQNFFSNSNPKCLLSKTFSTRLRFSYDSKDIFETMTKGQFSAHFQSD